MGVRSLCSFISLRKRSWLFATVGSWSSLMISSNRISKSSNLSNMSILAIYVTVHSVHSNHALHSSLGFVTLGTRDNTPRWHL